MRVILTGARRVERELDRTLEQTVKDVSNVVYREAREATPVRTGYTKSKWNQSVKDDDFTVSNRVPWIERLEKGASKQAPRGIIGPTLTATKRGF